MICRVKKPKPAFVQMNVFKYKSPHIKGKRTMHGVFEKKELLDLMDVDCGEIDRHLLPPSAFRNARIAPVSNAAPPQGNPFLGEVSSMYKLLNKMPFAYR